MFVISALVIGSENAPALNHQAKIIGGEVANNNDWPWVVALVFRSDITVFCGGSLVAKHWVLTAAHCVYNKSNALDVLINPGLLSASQGERIAVKRMIVHPLFNRATLQNDIALLELAEPSQIEPIEIFSESDRQDNAGENAIAFGWGNTSTKEKTFPDELRQVILPIISNTDCKKHQPSISDSMLCAGFAGGGKDTCEGDSGGPLTVFDRESQLWRQIGITSFGVSKCAAIGYYGVYTRVQSFKTFITETICDPEQQLPAPFLKLVVNGQEVRATWNTSLAATDYRLNYAPYPAGTPVYGLRPLLRDQLIASLPVGSAYFVGITAYNGICHSDYSNIEHFSIE